jgi:CHAT domain-containing protein
MAEASRLRLGRPVRILPIAGLLVAMSLAAAPDQAAPATAAPPRSIRDILDSVEKSSPADPQKHEKQRQLVDAQPPAGADAKGLIGFYLRRSRAAADLGRAQQHLDDVRKALDLAEPIDDPRLVTLYIELGAAEADTGSNENGVAAQERALALAEQRGTPGVVGLRCALTKREATSGHFAAAEQQLALAEAAAQKFGAMPKHAAQREAFLALVEEARAVTLLAEGKPRPAETAVRNAIADIEAMQAKPAVKQDDAVQRSFALQESRMRSTLVNVLRMTGRSFEAEGEARKLVAEASANFGNGAPVVLFRLMLLAYVLSDEGRLDEAQALLRLGLKTALDSGAAPASNVVLGAKNGLATILASNGAFEEAAALFAEVNAAIGDDQTARFRLVEGNPRWIVALLGLHRAAEALPIAEARVATNARLYGEQSYRTALARGLRGAVLAQLGRREAAEADFAAALPRLVQASRNQQSDDGTLTSPERLRRTIFDAAIGFYMTAPDAQSGAAAAFRYADVARGLFVQASLQAAALRSATGKPELAKLIREDEDLTHQRSAVRELAAHTSLDRSNADTAKLEEDAARLDQQEREIRQQLKRRFPRFDRLIDPPPARIDEARQALREGEALVAFYVGEERLYAWAVPKDGPIAFAATPLGSTALAAMIAELRKSLAPDIDYIADMPAFDVALAHKLYSALLEPVKAGWTGAKMLLIVPHGPIAELPLGLLVTAAVAQPSEAKGTPLFAGYRKVPFLAREVATAELPSVAALVTLRELPRGPDNRRPFAGFADPWFTPQQAQEARQGRGANQGAAKTADDAVLDVRGFHRRAAPATGDLASAGLAALPRLPDTAVEVREVATALQADPQRDIFLGALANEQRVMSMKLDDRRIVMFATHGLIPGDLDGLDEAALALSAPGIPGSGGDGLLTVEKILDLKLDADWVVLSACNTAAGNGAGAEAVSGLGRAFFYAGARALLVTNWPVETRSARLLTTSTFRLQAADPTLTRAEAVRRAEIGLIDGPGVTDATGFTMTYAHPIFWAPFSLIGDGG